MRSRPSSKAIKAPLPVVDDSELGHLARHINNLASALEQAHEQQQAMAN
jgi:hypothetical protein